MRKFWLYICLLVVVFCSGCVSSQQKLRNTTTKGIYAIQDSLAAGRVDLAKKYALELTKVVPPPKTAQRITVLPVQVISKETGAKQTYIVLPQEYNGKSTLNVGSVELDKVVLEHPELDKQFKKEEKQTENFIKQVEDTQRSIVKQAEEPKKGFFSRMFGWFAGLGVVGILILIGSLIAIAIFAPTLIPVIAAWAGGLFLSLGQGISAFFKNLFNK